MDNIKILEHIDHIKKEENMKEQIEKIKENSLKEIKACKDEKALNELRVKYLGKKGELTLVLRQMGSVSPEERPKIRKFSKSNKR